jgi:putative oxidoreductase
MEKFSSLTQLFLRLALGIGYLVPGFDRLGVWGKYGERNISWGNWQHFIKYAGQVMSFLPSSLVNVFAVMATIAEIGFGVLLLVGRWTRIAAIGSGILTLFFALSMAISFGIVSPLSYSVFTASAASFLLATLPTYKWSLDNVFLSK